MPGKVKNSFLGLFCLSALWVSGCVETAMMYHGNEVTNVQVVTLQEGVQNAGTWETFDVVINYTYLKSGEDLEISGDVELGQSYQVVYDRLRYLDFFLFFTDEESRVLETVAFRGFLVNTTADKRKFTRSYKVPAGTVGFSFGYNGAVGGRDGHTRFYQLPLKN
ncbi:MAG: hypothetical protein KAU27_01375 [Desulfuromonadales bacterium]|nr:hypothetical protein [Desulfuromonadales bacterium]